MLLYGPMVDGSCVVPAPELYYTPPLMPAVVPAVAPVLFLLE